MHNASLKHAISERSPRRFLGWVVGLGIALTTAGINSAWGQQSTWKGAGGTPANPKTWKDPANWDNAPPAGGAAGYTLNFTGQNNAFVSSNNLELAAVVRESRPELNLQWQQQRVDRGDYPGQFTFRYGHQGQPDSDNSAKRSRYLQHLKHD